MWRENRGGFVCPTHPTETDEKLQTPFQSRPEAGVRNWFSLAYTAKFTLNVGEKDVIRSNSDVYCCDKAKALVDGSVFCRNEEVAVEAESSCYWEEYPSIWG